MTDTTQIELDGPVEPPRKNGELVFEAPWEALAFGIAMLLNHQEIYPWSEFSDRLAAEISAEGASHDATVLPVPPDTESRYYEQWLAVLEGLILKKELLTVEEIDVRTEEFAAGMWDDHHDQDET